MILGWLLKYLLICITGPRRYVLSRVVTGSSVQGKNRCDFLAPPPPPSVPSPRLLASPSSGSRLGEIDLGAPSWRSEGGGAIRRRSNTRSNTGVGAGWNNVFIIGFQKFKWLESIKLSFFSTFSTEWRTTPALSYCISCCRIDIYIYIYNQSCVTLYLRDTFHTDWVNWL